MVALQRLRLPNPTDMRKVKLPIKISIFLLSVPTVLYLYKYIGHLNALKINVLKGTYRHSRPSARLPISRSNHVALVQDMRLNLESERNHYFDRSGPVASYKTSDPSDVIYEKTDNNFKNNAAPVETKTKTPNPRSPFSQPVKTMTLVDIPTNFNYSHSNRTVKFTILWYNPAEWILRRTTYAHQETCEYNNCRVTFDRNWLRNSSAIVFGITMGGMGREPPISPADRNKDQIWVFYSLEPPIYHVFQNEYKSLGWSNTMNWSMTFNLDSDIFAPYGTLKTRKTIQKRDYESIFSMKNKTALWVVSNCVSMSKRQEFVAALQSAGLDVDVYGSCGAMGRFTGDIRDLSKRYKFYLSMENSFCKYYITEKVFERMGDDVISVIRGGADYSRLLPNVPYIDAGKFANASSLAKYLLSLGANKERYIEMLKQKDKFYTLNEDDFGYPYAMCELCKKLNNPDGKRKVYANLAEEVQREGRCINPKDIVVK